MKCDKCGTTMAKSMDTCEECGASLLGKAKPKAKKHAVPRGARAMTSSRAASRRRGHNGARAAAR